MYAVSTIEDLTLPTEKLKIVGGGSVCTLGFLITHQGLSSIDCDTRLQIIGCAVCQCSER